MSKNKELSKFVKEFKDSMKKIRCRSNGKTFYIDSDGNSVAFSFTNVGCTSVLYCSLYKGEGKDKCDGDIHCSSISKYKFLKYHYDLLEIAKLKYEEHILLNV